MGNLVKIGNQEISKKEFNNYRVVTFKDIDTVHERPDGTARRNFKENKKHFIKNTDYFEIDQPDEIRTLGIERPQGGTPEKVILRKSDSSYFRKVKPLSQIEMMRIQLGMVDDHENRIVNLENNMTLDYGQQRVLEDTVNKTVIDVLGGKGSYAYKEIGKKVFAECNRDLKHYFNVNARNNVPKRRFDEAVEYAKKWKPCTNTMMNICNYNAPIVLQDRRNVNGED